MGARHKGDIAHLCSIAQPNIGLVLKVGTAHVGEFGSVAAIAETKSELISSLSPEATAILGTYDEYTPKMAALHKGKKITFGEGSECDIRATDIEVREGRAHFDLVTPEGRSAVGLRLVGLHQVANALAVASVATVLGFSLDQIASGLSTAESHAKWRMEIHELPSLVLINDAYNASPEAMAAALQTLVLFAQERGGESWAFLGKMHELGASSHEHHSRLGTLASELGIDHLVCVSSPEYAALLNSTSATTIHLLDSKESAADLVSQMSQGDVVLVKASRAEKFEEIAEMIKDAEKNASEDKKRKDSIEVKNRADTLIYSTEKSLKEHGEKIAGNIKDEIEEAIKNLKAVLEEDDIDKIKEKTDILAEASIKIGEAMYTPNADGTGDTNSNEHTDSEDAKVVDGEFKDVSNDNK